MRVLPVPGNSLCDESLTSSGGSEEENALWWLYTESLEKLRMSQGKFNHLTNFGHLLTAATNIIITNTISSFFILAGDWLTFVKKHSVGRNNAVWCGVHINNLELYGLELSSNNKGVIFTHWSVAVLEIGDQVSLSNVS